MTHHASQLTTYHSNKLESLYEQLKEELFQLSDTDVNSLPQRWVVVHGPAMKSWLMWRMAQDPALRIAAGIDVIYLSQLFSRLAPTAAFPSFLEISLAAEIEIRRVLKSPSQTSLWQPVIDYLSNHERRIASLSQQIARLFADYAKYGLHMVSGWEANEASSWQQDLWKKLFCAGTKGWSILQDYTCIKAPAHTALHLFSISFLSQLEFSFLKQISLQLPVHYYLLSPCETFWSDIRSGKESQRLHDYWQKRKASEAQLETLDELLRDTNPLLANFGRIGREMADQIDHHDCETVTCYEEPQRDTLLHAIQSDILLLRNPSLEPITPMGHDDRSIEVHMASSPLREVQILYDTLISLIEQSQRDHDPIHPSDIIVMAPDISAYEAHIKTVSTESQLSCQIIDLKSPSQNPLLQGFWHLIALGQSRWDATSLMQLFEDPAFQKRHQLTTEEVYTIREWIEKAAIRWGFDATHRNEFLEQSHCQKGMVDTSSTGTWNHGLTQLLFSLAMEPSDRIGSDYSPVNQIDFSKSDLLGKLLRLIDSLQDDLKPLHDGTEMALADWATFLTCLFKSYFSAHATDPQSIKEYDGLIDQIDLLRQASSHLPQEPFPFSSVKKHLEESIQQKSVGYRENHFHAVRFCSMIPLRAIPARVIALIGMNEGKFPRQENPSSLNLLAKDPRAHYCPNQSDYDRYLFLETLLSVRDHFIISYQGANQESSKEQAPSLLVTELLSYLDKFYQIKDRAISIIRHPFDPFDKSYFSEGTGFKSYSQAAFRAAKAYYHIDKQPPHAFVSDFSIRISPPIETSVDLKQLSAAARHPIKMHINRTLDIYLDKEEKRRLKNEEEVTLSSLDKYLLIQQSIRHQSDPLLDQADKKGILPLGAFKEVSKRRIKRDASAIHQQLSDRGICQSSLFEIEFVSSCLKPQEVSENRWHLPALQVPYQGGIISITGALSTVSQQGLVVMGKSSLGDIWKNWPHFLLFSYACQTHPLPMEKQLIFVHPNGTKAFKTFFDDPSPHLIRFLDYYFSCLSSLSPLMPDWLVPILKGDAPALKQLIEKQLTDPFSISYDDYTRWSLNGAALPDCEAIISHWQPHAEALLGDIEKSLNAKVPKE
jgi:exodeoxyribonuclease V gamma subunit